MADAIEVVGGPPAVDQSGNLTVWYVPMIADPAAGVTLAEIGAAGAHRITYSFVPGGWALSMPQEKNDDPRLTSPQRRQSLGIINPDLADLNYVASTDPGSADVILEDKTGGFFVERRNIPQTALAAAAQKVRIVKTGLGPQAEGEVTGSGKFTKTQPAVVEGVWSSSILA